MRNIFCLGFYRIEKLDKSLNEIHIRVLPMQEISLLEKTPAQPAAPFHIAAQHLEVTTAAGASCCTHFTRKEDYWVYWMMDTVK
jgi:hypothetical protein